MTRHFLSMLFLAAVVVGLVIFAMHQIAEGVPNV